MAAVLRQSFAWWSFTWGRAIEPAALLGGAAEIGYQGVEMLPAELWPLAEAAGLTVATVACADPTTGFNEAANHDWLTAEVRDLIASGAPNVIVFSGNRHGEDDDDAAIATCAEGLAPLAEEADAAGVTLLLELLNSKVDHPGYQCDHTAFGAAIVEKVASPALRLLYDGYHMQLMEGDLSRTIRANLPLIGHVHTGGVPGRRDLDDRQEVNWRAVGGLLRHLGYDGWVGHEFVPRAEPVDALRAAYEVMAG